MKPNGAWSNASQTAAAPMPAEVPAACRELARLGTCLGTGTGGIRVRLSELQRDACPLG
jgi:hypothetical protein